MKDCSIPFCREIPRNWQEIPNRYLFDYHSFKVGDRWKEYQLLSLTTSGVKLKDINAGGGKVPDSYDKYQTVEPGDMIFCLFDLDVSAVFSGLSHNYGMITSAYDVVRPNHELLNQGFSDYWFQYVFSNRYYKMYSKNIRFTITSEMFRSIKTPIPPMSIQKKIAAFLDSKSAEIERLIEIENQQIEKLKEYKQAVITEAVTKGLDKSAPMKDSGVEWIGKIPEGWRVCRIKNVANISNGKEIEAEGGGVPVYGSGGIFKYTDKPLFSGTSLLLGRKGTIDKPMLVQGDFWTVDTMFYTGEIRNIAPNYLYYCAKSLICFDYFKSGSVLPSMTQSELNNIFITYPDFLTQNQIVECLDEKCKKIDSLIDIKQKKIDELNEYKKSLIYEYVTGKKEVV